MLHVQYQPWLAPCLTASSTTCRQRSQLLHVLFSPQILGRPQDHHPHMLLQTEVTRLPTIPTCDARASIQPPAANSDEFSPAAELAPPKTLTSSLRRDPNMLMLCAVLSCFSSPHRTSSIPTRSTKRMLPKSPAPLTCQG